MTKMAIVAHTIIKPKRRAWRMDFSVFFIGNINGKQALDPFHLYYFALHIDLRDVSVLDYSKYYLI